MSAEGWVDVLRTEAAAARPWPVLSDYVPLFDRAEAYRIRHLFLGGERLTAPGYLLAYRRGNTVLEPPAVARLVDGGERRHRATLRLDAAPYRSACLRIGFELRSPILRAMRSVDDLSTYVSSARLVLELPRGRFGAAAAPRDVDWIAVNLGISEWIRGKKLPATDAAGLATLTFRLERNGSAMISVRPADVGRRPLAELLWLVNELHTHGSGPVPGQLLLTGAVHEFGPIGRGRYDVLADEQTVLSFNAADARHRAARARRPR